LTVALPRIRSPDCGHSSTNSSLAGAAIAALYDSMLPASIA
jgi:hypothetical protein